MKSSLEKTVPSGAVFSSGRSAGSVTRADDPHPVAAEDRRALGWYPYGRPPPREYILEPVARYVRSPVYVLRAVLGALLLALGFVAIVLFENALIGLFKDSSDMVDSWPEWIDDLPVAVLAALAATIGVGINVWLVTTRHWRRLAVINTAAIAALLAHEGATELALTLATSNVLREALDLESPGVALGRFLPTLIAVVTVGVPWVRRRLRPWAVAGTATYGVALAFFALSPPLLIVLDVGLGILVGALIGLIFKTPNMAPTHDELVAALDHCGVVAVDLAPAAVDARGSSPWFTSTADGQRMFIKVLSSSHRAADLLFRLYRWLRYRQAGDRRPYTSLRRAVEHEALGSLQATNRGIPTPRFMAIADVGGDGMMLTYEAIEGRSLDNVAPEELTDSALEEVWRLIHELHQSGMAHRDLRLANIFMTRDGELQLIDFGFAELSAEESHRALDIAEALSSTAAIVGVDRALAAATKVMPMPAIAYAAAWVQPQAVGSATRQAMGSSEGFDKLRAAIQDATGVAEVGTVKIERVSLRSILILVSLGLAAYVLIPMIADAGNLWEAVRGAGPGWVLIALAASLATYVGATIGIKGSLVSPLPFRLTLIAQLASSFSNRITPAKVGGLATNVRYLKLCGIAAPTAVSAIGLNTLAGTMIHIPATVALGVLAGREAEGFPLPSVTTITWVVLGVVAVSGLVMAIPLGRRLVLESLWPALKSAFSSIGDVARNPRKLATLFLGSFIVTSMYTVAMAASLQAFGAETALVTVAFVYLAGSAVSAAAPTPGGVGATEAALAAGYTAVGVSPEVAVPAVLLFRLVTFWLPILPGWLAFAWMQRAGKL
ncbi:MAG: flippase-like domain-containing protein [bacterium]|nr:flippase-like domain-containing protein [bacterium]